MIVLTKEDSVYILDYSTLEVKAILHNPADYSMIDFDLRTISNSTRLRQDLRRLLYEYGAIVDERE